MTKKAKTFLEKAKCVEISQRYVEGDPRIGMGYGKTLVTLTFEVFHTPELDLQSKLNRYFDVSLSLRVQLNNGEWT